MVVFLVVIACWGAATAQDAPGVQAQVAVPRLEYHDTPGGRGFSAGLLGPGAVVEVMRVEPSGWAAIAPPAGSYCWIDQEAVQPDEEGGPFGLVIAPDATARVGSQGARMPGPPRYQLNQGDRVRLVELPPLAVGGRKWRAIEPPRGVVYYVPADALRLQDGKRLAAAPEPVEVLPPQPVIAGDLTAVGPRLPEGRVPPELASQIRTIEAEHRGMLRLPMARWQLSLIRARYQGLLRQAEDPDSRAYLQGHLDQVARQQAAADSARRVDTLLEQEASLARHAQEPPPTTDEPLAIPRPPFDVVGMLQPSSKLAGGRQVYAVIGEEGYAVAYLRVPPGLLMEPLLSRQVGVRGSFTYDEGLRANVVLVTEIEGLSPAP